MNNFDFEKVLNKDVSFFKNEFNAEVVKNNFDIKFYSVLLDKTYFYYDIPYNQITVYTNEEEVIEKLTIHFKEVIDNNFFESFNTFYGAPNSIKVIKDKILVSETIVKDSHNSTLEHHKKSEFDLREGTFEEKPLYIIWEKEGYEIRAFLRHKQNISDISFVLIDKD